jgi:multiple sugar transport system substrate-binding protein
MSRKRITTIVCVCCILGLLAFSSALAASDFDWQKYSGTSIKLLLNKHPYTDALLAHLNEFTAKTGIKVTYDVFPEDEYFDKVTISLSSKSPEYSLFMTGAYQVWQYAPPGYMEDLRPYMESSEKTNPDWDQADIYENLLSSLAWNLKPGAPLGTPDAKQWALPWGFETNTLIYRKDIFDKHGLKPPKDLPALLDVCAKLQKLEPEMYPIAVRGTRSWATIHPGFLSCYNGYGAKDYDPFPKPAMNSPKAVEMTKLWMEMVKKYGPKAWTSYIWYEVGNDLGQGRACMIYDADILGYFQDQPGASKASGKLAWAPGPGAPGAKFAPNMWIWSLGMNSASKTKDAAWYFLQWATGKDFLLKAVRGKFSLVDPIRKSVWADAEFQKKLEDFTDYYKTFQEIIPTCKVYFTPQPLFFETTTEWAATLQEIYNGKDTKKALDELVNKLTRTLKRAGYR